MSEDLSRRQFIKKSSILTAGVASAALFTGLITPAHALSEDTSPKGSCENTDGHIIVVNAPPRSERTSWECKTPNGGHCCIARWEDDPNATGGKSWKYWKD